MCIPYVGLKALWGRIYILYLHIHLGCVRYTYKVRLLNIINLYQNGLHSLTLINGHY